VTGPEGGAIPQPWVLDVSVLAMIAGGDGDMMELAQSLDSGGRPLVIPVLAIAGALAGGDDEAPPLLRALERLGNSMPAPVQGAPQAARLADVIRRTGLDPWDAHVASVADASVCPIVTLDPGKWRGHAHDLDEPLHLIEIEDPEE
jgi:predicted nucleic acid-binding protein